VQDTDSYNRRLLGNRVWPIEWHDCQWPWVKLKATFAVLNLSNTHNSGNIACFNCSVCINWKVHVDLLFKLYCQRWRRWRTSQGHRQSCTLQKWKYTGNDATVDRDVVITGHWQAGVGIARGWGLTPPVHVYRRSFLSENRFKISTPVQNFKHFDIWPPVLLGQFQHCSDRKWFRICGASRGPSAFAELLVILTILEDDCYFAPKMYGAATCKPMYTKRFSNPVKHFVYMDDFDSYFHWNMIVLLLL